MNAIPLYQDIKNKVTRVIDYSIGKKGLEINYVYNGTEKILFQNPEHTCKMLKESCLINDWCGSGDDITIEVVTELNEVDHHGEHIQKELVQHIHWDIFIFDFNLNRFHAHTLVTDYEFSKAMKEWFDSCTDKARNAYKLNSAHSHLLNNGFLS